MNAVSPVETLITDHLDQWTTALKRKSTAGRGSSSKVELYGIKKLRELIYEFASKGLLVPKGRDACNDYLNLSDISEFVMGQAPAGNECNKDGKGTVFVKTGEFGQRYPEIKEWTTKPLKLARKGDVLICVVGATVGKLNFGIDCAIGRSVAAIRPGEKILTEYLYISLVPFTIKLRQNSRGSAQGVIGKTELSAVRIRVPPKEEQHRIVAKVDELMALCDQLEQQTDASLGAHQTLVETLLSALTSAADHAQFASAWQRIAGHFDTLFTTEESIAQLKQTILQLAVMGKLVPQDPNDEPASELLKKIAARPHKYTLPGWATVSLGQLGDILGGATPSKSNAEYWTGNIPWVSPKDMKRNVITDAEDHVSEAAISNSSLKKIPPGSLLMVVRGMILAHSFPVAISECEVTINQDMKALVIPPELGAYLLTFMQAMKGAFVALVDRSSHGTCKLVSEKLWSYPVSLPPLAEQHRIVARVDELMALCDQLKSRLSDAQATQLHLADALVERAIG